MPDNLFTDMSQDAVVYVYRRDEVSKEPVFMYKLSPEEAHVDEIQRLSGGGYYTCRERGRNEEGRKVWQQQRTLRVGGAPREPRMPQSYESESTAATPRPGEVETGAVGRAGVGMDEVLTAGILKLLQGSADLSTAQAEAYKNMANRPAAPATDWGALITAAVPVVVAMIKKREDPMEVMTRAAALFKDNASPATAFKDQLSTITEVFNLKEAVTPPPPDPIESALGMLPQLLDIITAEQKSGRPVTVETVQQRLAAGTGATPPASPPAAQYRDAKPMWLKMLTQLVPRTLSWASQGKDPALLAEFFVNEIPEQHAGHLREFLQRADAKEMLFRLAPGLAQYEQWVGECFDAMADHYFGEPDAEEVDAEEVVEVEEVEVISPDDAKMAAIDAARAAEAGESG